MVNELNEKEFNEKIKEGKVLVDCYATWCGPCKMLSPIIDEVSNEVKNYTFYKLDVDENENIAEEYGIMSIPTLLIFEDGKLKEKIMQIVALLVPMFVISYKKAEDLAHAMEARGYIPGEERTKIEELKYRF